jgi:hypothetical protein
LSATSRFGAPLASAKVVRANFCPRWGWIGLILLIDIGSSLVWRALSGQPAGLAVSIVVNAYVGTGRSPACSISEIVFR